MPTVRNVIPEGVKANAFEGESTLGRGVTGKSDADYGVRAHSRQSAGLRGSSDLGRGVEGWATASEGVVGVSVSGTGVMGETQGAGVGVAGRSTDGSGVVGASVHGRGVNGVSTSSYGLAGESHSSAGVRGTSVDGRGAEGWSTRSEGVVGISTEGTGVWGQTDGAGTGVVGTSGSGVGVLGRGGRLAGRFEGDVEVTGDIRLINADCAEDFDVLGTDEVEPGTVMVLRAEQALAPSRTAYDRCVVGVISGAGGFRPALVLDTRSTGAQRAPVALMGKVYCKADARRNAIAVGDLLTTSTTPGHAMKATDPAQAFGAVLGKAMAPLAGGLGLVPVLISLQ